LSEMCEFEVLVGSEVVFKDVVYVKAEGGEVILKDVLGGSKVFKGHKIIEVDVTSERLMLAPSKPK